MELRLRWPAWNSGRLVTRQRALTTARCRATVPDNDVKTRPSVGQVHSVAPSRIGFR